MKSDGWDGWDGFTRFADTFFNGRKAAEAAEEQRVSKPSITVRDLVARKTSIVKCDGKLYQIVVTEMELTKKV